MTETLRVALLQREASLDPAANRESVGPALSEALGEEGADLVVLPEAFARDFGEPGSDVSPFAEPLDGPFVEALRTQAARHQVSIVAGMFETSEDLRRPFNTVVCVGPEGGLDAYRKIHLYDSFGMRESEVMSAGAPSPVTVEVRGFRLGLMTCYDLRFPELARLLAGVDAYVVPAAWVAGELKVDHWRTLARARAIENVAYVLACGQPGPRYTGYSLVADPLGVVLAEADDGDGRVVRATLDRAVLESARRRNPSLDNRRLPAHPL